MSEYGTTPAEPRWWKRFHEGTFDDTHPDGWGVPNIGLLAVVTSLIVSSISGSSGTGYQLVHLPAGIVLDSAAVGAGAGTDCFKSANPFTLAYGDGSLEIYGVNTGNWHWSIYGYYVPDYYSTVS